MISNSTGAVGLLSNTDTVVAWYGFCNDQYCFAQLQKLVAEKTGYELGSYFHFAHNLHLYKKDLEKYLPQRPDNLMQRKADHYG